MVNIAHFVRDSNSIGIDIGATSVSVVEVAHQFGKPIIVKTVVRDIYQVEGLNQEEATVETLRKVLKEFDLRHAKIACVINCPQTYVRRIITPRMPPQELQEALFLEAKRFLPFPLEQMVIDFNAREETVEDGVTKFSVIVAASPRQTVDRLLSFFIAPRPKPFSGSNMVKQALTRKSLELPVSVFLPLSLCVENIIERSKLRTDETLVTVEMGTLMTELNIFKDSRLQFSRKIPVSGMDFTRSLVGTLTSEHGLVELNLNQAERIKCEYGIPQGGDDRLIDGKITLGQILAMLRPKAEQLANEIRRSLDFYREEMQGSAVDRIVLFGGAAQLKGLTDYLSAELDMDVSLGNPLSDINLLSERVIESKYAHRLVPAIGAAFSGMKGINLLPQKEKKRPTIVLQRRVFAVVAIMVMAILFSVYSVLKTEAKVYEARLKEAQRQLIDLTPEVQELKKKVLLEQFVKSRPDWDEYLKELSNIVPSGIFLTEFSMQQDEFQIKGVITPSANEADMAKLMSSLGKGLFKDITLVNVNKSSGQGSSVFEIKCKGYEND